MIGKNGTRVNKDISMNNVANSAIVTPKLVSIGTATPSSRYTQSEIMARLGGQGQKNAKHLQ